MAATRQYLVKVDPLVPIGSPVSSDQVPASGGIHAPSTLSARVQVRQYQAYFAPLEPLGAPTGSALEPKGEYSSPSGQGRVQVRQYQAYFAPLVPIEPPTVTPPTETGFDMPPVIGGIRSSLRPLLLRNI